MKTSEAGDRAGRRAGSWLAEAAIPGRRSFALSGAALTLETVFTVARWAGLAWAAQGVLDRDTSQQGRGVAAFTVAAVLAIAAGWTAGKLRERGARTVANRVRRQVAGALLPTAPRTRDTGPAEAGFAMLDLVDDISDYHATIAPLRWSAPLSILTVLAVTAALYWPAAIVLTVSTALIPLNMRLAGLFAKDGADQQLAATQRLNAVVLDSFRGVEALRELGAVGRRSRTLTVAADALNKATMRVLRRAFLSGMVMDIVITFSIAANATYIGLSLLGYVHVPHAPQLTLATGLLVLLICPMYFTPIRTRAAAFHERERALAAARAIGDITSPEEAWQAPSSPASTPYPRSSEPVSVALSFVRYRFAGADQDTVTADVDLAGGTWTAITGASGAGKSTLLSLIAGMLPPTAGQVWWQTSSARRAPQLGECAWVGQQTVLLDATVRDNLRLGRQDATEQRIRQAVDAAGLTAVIDRLPAGLDTRLGEGGWGVSTGEARRIAIARAFLREARLWLLDEPTAHLDAESERDVVAALRRATDGCTVIVATHSFALASASHTVLEIGNGILRDVSLVSAR